MRIFRHWRLAVKILPVVLLAIILKALVHYYDIEVLYLSSLFSGILGATVFLLGFMIAGTLTDYKESERLPSDLAASLHSIADECSMITAKKSKRDVASCIEQLDAITSSVLKWLRQNKNKKQILKEIENLNVSFLRIEPHMQTTFLSRIKSEQNQIRKIVLRMQTIRETTFVGTGYAIAELSSLLLLTGLIFTRDQPFFESLFFIGLITFILAYMIALITDLDNPYDYGQELAGYEVSLKPLEDFRKRIKSLK